MTRRLLALFAPSMLAAQVKLTPTTGSGGRIPRPKNGECPQCGTLAEPYKPDLTDYAGLCKPCQPAATACNSVCSAYTDADLPVARRIDCAYCNTTYRQWAEGKEPKK